MSILLIINFNEFDSLAIQIWTWVVSVGIFPMLSETKPAVICKFKTWHASQ